MGIFALIYYSQYVIIFYKGEYMKEYEYTFKVDDVLPYIQYCEDNGFKKKCVTKQNRKVFENQNAKHIIARITTTIQDGEENIVLDFKNVGNKSKHFKISEESLPLTIKKDDIKIVLSMLEVVDFTLSADNHRTRYEYIKDDIKFEIDDYTIPPMKIVAIEGKEEKVEEIVNNLQNTINHESQY